VRSDVPLFESYVTTQSPQEAYQSILADVGANLPRLDPVDTRILQDVRKRGSTLVGSKSKLPGIIDTQADAGGWPRYQSGEPPVDSDHDGIPDAWERQHGLNPNDPFDAARDSGDGYTFLEKYLNSIRAQ
jgi:pectate lyase